LLVEAILETPGLAPRLAEVLRPKKQGSGIREQGSDERTQGAVEKLKDNGAAKKKGARK
jgi:hypothetical protein